MSIIYELRSNLISRKYVFIFPTHKLEFSLPSKIIQGRGIYLYPFFMEEPKTTKDKYWIKPGMAVAHRTNLGFMYTVKTILKESREIKCDKEEEGSYFNEKEQCHMKRKTFMKGIEVQFINRYQAIDTEIFHSRELIPWEIAQQGVKVVNDWLKQQIN